jgi:hypothetical protein
MRIGFVLLSLTLATSASAWEFSPVPVCTLRHGDETGSVTLTWDPTRDQAYAIAVSRGAPWPDGSMFAITFEGARGLTISTGRHVISDDGSTLTVTDRGFGNVLDGLEFGDRAVADLDGARIVFSLAGAAGPVRDFRACTAASVASSGSDGVGASSG